MPFGQWNRFMLEMNYATHDYAVYLNGALLRTSDFVDDEMGIVGFTDAPLATLAAGPSAAEQAAPGTAFYDNYRIDIVPEPGSLAMIGVASLALLRRRR